MYLTKFAGFLACATGLIAASSAPSAEPLLFSYLDPSTDGVMATTTAPSPAASRQPSTANASVFNEPAAAPEPAIGTWTTVVTRPPVLTGGAPALAGGPMAMARATSKDRQRTASSLPGPRLTGTGHSLSGIASYYWQEQMTATGERFNKRDLTAAHRTLPFGTRVRVTRLDTGANVIVRINDRGPFKPGRVIDLSERAAEDIGMTGKGLTAVSLEVLGR